MCSQHIPHTVYLPEVQLTNKDRQHFKLKSFDDFLTDNCDPGFENNSHEAMVNEDNFWKAVEVLEEKMGKMGKSCMYKFKHPQNVNPLKELHSTKQCNTSIMKDMLPQQIKKFTYIERF